MFIWPNHPAFTTSLAKLKGVGPKTLARFEEEGYFTTGDLLATPPKFYQDRRRLSPIAELIPGAEALVEACVLSSKLSWSPKTKRRFLTCRLEDENGDTLDLIWFNAPAYMAKSLPRGTHVRAFGKLSQNEGGRRTISHPDLEILTADELGQEQNDGAKPGLRPVYSAIGEIPGNLVKKLVTAALPLLAECPPLMPVSWCQETGWLDPVQALATLHSPPSDFSGPAPRPAETKAFGHLVRFELFFWRLLMLRARAKAENKVPRPQREKGLSTARNFWANLPFAASPEQERVSAELWADLAGNRPMSRLLQGEVGGGKTAVAAAALFFALGCGGQGALMAPTELLARQHYEFLKEPAAKLGFQVVLLTGSLKEAEKKEIRRQLADGSAQLAVGSQALLSAATSFKNLTLAVIDEQHRFGVRQRLSLRQKCASVDLLAMSATPIPRSYAAILYGDLDYSELKGLLPGRSPAATSLFAAEESDKAFEHFLELLAQEGGQGLVVTPRLGQGENPTEESEPQAGSQLPELASLDFAYKKLQKMAPPNMALGRLHGQMDAASQQKIMGEFRHRKCQVLVATSIVEVGVDVPSVRVILVVGADRFGLAQLHQLRGRVGRAAGEKGHCLLLPLKASGLSRLAGLVNESCGQKVAELDLAGRGPGEQLGLRQSGWPKMRYARLPQDLTRLAESQKLAKKIWADSADPIWQHLDFSTIEEKLAFDGPPD